jgi:hypothetical protein
MNLREVDDKFEEDKLKERGRGINSRGGVDESGPSFQHSRLQELRGVSSFQTLRS